jgi:hypothetical protein
LEALITANVVVHRAKKDWDFLPNPKQGYLEFAPQ